MLVPAGPCGQLASRRSVDCGEMEDHSFYWVHAVSLSPQKVGGRLAECVGREAT